MSETRKNLSRYNKQQGGRSDQNNNDINKLGENPGKATNMAISGDYYLKQELSTECSDDENVEDTSTDEVDDDINVVSEDDNVDVGGEDALFSGSESKEDEEDKENSNEGSVRISTTKAVLFYANSMDMEKQDWGDFGDGNVCFSDDLKTNNLLVWESRPRLLQKQSTLTMY